MEEHKPASLASKTAKGAGWLIGWRFATRTIGSLSTLILARLLIPADFGVIALATTFSIAVDALSAIGVEDALIREKEPQRDMYDTAFTVNAIRGALNAIIVACCAWPASYFFHEPRLVPIVLLLAATMFVGGFDNIGTVDFRRTLAFEKEFQLRILPRVSGSVLTIVWALVSPTYWALMAGIVLTRFLRSVLTYKMHPFRPRFSLRSWRKILAFSLWTWAVSLVLLVRDRSDTLVIGNMRGTSSVGVFALGSEIGLLPATEMLEPLAAVLFSTFSVSKRGGDESVTPLIRAVGVAAFLTFPAGVGISLIANPLVTLVFGARWLESVPVIEVLGVSGVLAVFTYIITTMMLARGQPSLNFRIYLASAATRLTLLIALTPHFGLVGAAIAIAAGSTLDAVLSVHISLKWMPLSLTDYASQLWRTLLGTGVMTLVLVGLGLGWNHQGLGMAHAARDLGVAIALGATTYTVVTLGAWYASGCPLGGESYVLGQIRGVWQKVAHQASGQASRPRAE